MKVLILISQAISCQYDLCWDLRIRPRMAMTSHFSRILKRLVFITDTGLCRSWSISGDHSCSKTVVVVEKEFTNSCGSLHLCVLPSVNAKRLPAYIKAAAGCIRNSVFILTQVKELPQMATHTIIKVREWQTCAYGRESSDGIQSLGDSQELHSPPSPLGYQYE